MERLYVDSGYYLMRIINHQGFWIEHHRMILVFPEWLPLLGIYLKLPLKIVILLYSIGHVFFFYIAFLISRYGLQNKMAGYQLALIQVLGLIHGFFVPVFELYYGCGLAVVFFSILQKEGLSNRHIIAALLLLAFALMSHPMMIFLVGGITLIHAIGEKKINRFHIGILITMVAVFTFKYFVKSEYEAGKTQAFMNNLKSLSYSGNYIRDFTHFVFTRYLDVLVLVLLATTSFIIGRKKLLALVFVVAFFGILILCNINYRGFDASRYAEQVYFPIAAVVLLTLPFLPWKNLKKGYKYLILAVLVLVFAHRLFTITKEGKEFAKRTDAIEKLCIEAQNNSGSKFIIAEAPFDSTYTPSANWSVTIESLFISGSSNDMETVTICLDIDYSESIVQGRIPTETDYLFRRWEMFPDSTLNQAYFKLEPSSYQPLDMVKILGLDAEKFGETK